MLGDAEPVCLTDWVGRKSASCRDESTVVMVLSTPVEKEGYDDGGDNNSDDDEQGS